MVFAERAAGDEGGQPDMDRGKQALFVLIREACLPTPFSKDRGHLPVDGVPPRFW
jgi:hypothetical protein